MTKHNSERTGSKSSRSCDKSSSDSTDCSVSDYSSDSTDKSCHFVKCREKCGDKVCPKPCPCKYTAEEIHCNFADAVVGIQSEFILLTDALPAGANNLTPLAVNSRLDTYVNGNGFFTMFKKCCKTKCGKCTKCEKKRYIVCPAHLVLMPPSLTSAVRRFPFNLPLVPLGQIQDQMVRASRIIVSVFNVNKLGSNETYEAELVGVDGSGDLAILKINYDEEFNRGCTVKVEKCHPYLKFGRSRKAVPGTKVYLIGDFVSSNIDARAFNAAGAIVEGIVSDNRYVDYLGYTLPEQVLVSAPAYAYSSGLPIIDCNGRVIAMQTTDVSAVLPTIQAPLTPTAVGQQGAGVGFVAGPSQFALERVYRILIKGASKNHADRDIESICDAAGQYYRFTKSYLGIAYQLVTSTDYTTTVDFTSGVAPLGRRRVRLNANGGFVVCPRNKKIVGIKVVGLAGLNPTDAAGIANGYFYVPGGGTTALPIAAPLPAVLPESPVIGRIFPGDIITHFDKYRLGDLNRQIAPYLVTSHKTYNSQIDIAWKHGGACLNAASNGDDFDNYDHSYRQRFCLARYPACLDYPWGSVDAFPLIDTTYDVAGITLPATQLKNRQYIQLNTVGAGIFHPAL